MVKIKISFTDAAPAAHRETCPVCASTKRTPLLSVSVTHNDPASDRTLHLALCQTCGSGYFTDQDPVRGYGAPDFERDYWLNYVQNGAGISAMVEPLLAIDQRDGKSLLDIGCGFGFVPHFWQSNGFGDAVGMEVTEYGWLGADKLGITVVPKYYGDAEELHGRPFDYVFSSEVIEHVEDPVAFVTEISAALAAGGIMVLTTPSAQALSPDHPNMNLLQVLSPGFHYFIASRQGLEDLLKRCGFAHVLVRDDGNRLFAWASHTELPDIADGFQDWPIYLDYLEKLAEVEDPHVSGGALYRAMKDNFNLGHLDRAAAIYDRFAALAKAQYKIDFNDLAASAPWRRSRTDMDNRTYPSWMGVAILYAGLIQQKRGAPLAAQLRFFAEAIETMQQEIDLSAQFAGEPAHFIGRAKAEHRQAWGQVQSDSPCTRDPQQRFVLRRPKLEAGQDICLMSVYAPDGQMSPATMDYMSLMAANGYVVIACLALDNPTVDLNISDFSAAQGIVIRGNQGMDFSAWATALELLPECWSARRLAFTNDSIFALPTLMGPFIEDLRRETADFVFVTECFLHTHHGQSYFFQLQAGALQNPDVKNFWTELKPLDKPSVIREYELTLLGRASGPWKLSTQVMYAMDRIFPGVTSEDCANLNICHSHWCYLIGLGFPFVKVELLRDNPSRLPIQHWRAVLASHGVSLENVEAHLKIPRTIAVPSRGLLRRAEYAVKGALRRRKAARRMRRTRDRLLGLR